MGAAARGPGAARRGRAWAALAAGGAGRGLPAAGRACAAVPVPVPLPVPRAHHGSPRSSARAARALRMAGLAPRGARRGAGGNRQLRGSHSLQVLGSNWILQTQIQALPGTNCPHSPCCRDSSHHHAVSVPSLPQPTLCRLRTHQWCFILFNLLLFHLLLFGADLLEEYFLRSFPLAYTDAKTLEIRERARKLDTEPLKANLSGSGSSGSSAATCSAQEVFLLILVHSSPGNRTRRDRIRQTWGNVTDTGGYTVLTLFAVGKAASESAQLEISAEAQKHRDIIEGAFIDSPQTQTQKMLLSVEWTVTFCPQARFILKADEDVFVGVASLAGYLLSLTQLEDIYLGRVVHQGVPDRAPHSPAFVPTHEYPEEFFPDFCHGSAFVVSQDVARKVYVAAQEVPPAVPPDVFVGICAKRAGITPMHSSRFAGGRHISYNRCCYKFIFTSSNVKEDELFKAWQETSSGEDCSLLETYYSLVSCRVLTYIDKFKQLNLDRIKNEVLHFVN
ncbi:beta-1,3-galactosyltransferase 9 [Myiozetetes cayanensis]|uniref:beta-1,3-galactosyltransferase 9 n=1 Tax=Myiozetetes cayanensis TaxID=478635 RepID=UPI00215E64C4|nr:beta-1,3-galactosyltransferase 9 [Myiozetetes cayanensis]